MQKPTLNQPFPLPTIPIFTKTAYKPQTWPISVYMILLALITLVSVYLSVGNSQRRGSLSGRSVITLWPDGIRSRRRVLTAMVVALRLAMSL
jgi:hypothetical protein